MKVSVIIERFRAFVGLGQATRNLSDATRRRSISDDDDVRLAVHGDIPKASETARKFAAKLEKLAKSI